MIADLRYALRQLLRAPGFALSAVVTLALGIGACTAAYSLARGLLWRPMPFPDAGRLVVIRSANPGHGVGDEGVSFADLRDLGEQATSFTALAALAQRQAAVGSPDGAERVTGWLADPVFFTLFGIPAELGRTFRPDEADASAAPVAVLSHGFWVRHFGADRSVIGRTLPVDGVSRTIVGVMPDSFRVVRGDIWLPLVPDPTESRAWRYRTVIGRLKAGSTPSSAAAELATISARLEAANPGTNRGVGFTLVTYRERMVDHDSRRALALLLAAVGLVLLIACANVAGLMLARGAGRSRELAVRAAVGASRGRLLRAALAECAVLSVCGALAGLLLASWGNDLLLATLPLEDVPPWLDQSLDATSLGVTALVTLSTVFLCGLLPALRASRPVVVDVLKGSSLAVSGTRARSALVIGQVALAVTLLAAASLFSQSFLARQRGRFGFDDRPVLTARVFFGALPRDARRAWMARALDQVRGTPGVSGAALTGAIPGDDGGEQIAFAVEGRAVAAGDEPRVTVVPSSDGLTDALGITPQAGRWFTRAEATDSLATVAVVGATLVRTFWPSGDAVGHRFRLLPDTAWITVVGVVPDLQWEELGEDGASDRLQVHLPYGARPWRGMALMVRAATTPAALAEPLRQVARSVSSDVPVFDVRTMSAVRRETSAGERVWLLMFGALGLQALLMTAVGLYGLLAYGVAQRQREIGVRVALGARPGAVVRLVVARAIGLTVLGLILGLGGAVVVAQVLRGLLWGVSGSAAPVALVGVLLLLTALAAALLPARRAARVDPMVALRAD